VNDLTAIHRMGPVSPNYRCFVVALLACDNRLKFGLKAAFLKKIIEKAAGCVKSALFRLLLMNAKMNPPRTLKKQSLFAIFLLFRLLY
jgi:hypothetical protein